MGPNLDTLEIVSKNWKMIGIRRACDQYLFNFHEELIKNQWKAIQHASETFVIESSVYFVNFVYNLRHENDLTPSRITTQFYFSITLYIFF